MGLEKKRGGFDKTRGLLYDKKMIIRELNFNKRFFLVDETYLVDSCVHRI